ncbi:MAG TPA: DUF255 domain-containing protein [Phaeodactylibacter sp.]|nr:DUF255 domain-containing protein [Phaeodactylibacter sp.]
MRHLILTIAFLIFSMIQIKAQGIEFFHGTWEEALEKAKLEEKVIFIDAFAVWCGPCKRMARNVFTQQKVGDFFNKNFINMKLDMERGEGLKFRQKYPVSAFPTLFFIDAKGDVVHKQRGAQQVDGLLALAKMVLGKVDYSKGYAEEYEKGNRDPKLIYNYVKALNKSGKPSIKVSNEYLKTQKDLTTEHNLRFILEAASEADSRIFDLLIKHRKKIVALVGEQAVKDKIEKACTRTAQKSLEFEMQDLLTEAISKMKKYYPAHAKSFALNQELKFYLATSDVKNYLKCCADFVKKEVNGDANKLNSLAQEILQHFPKDAKAMKHAEKLAKMATSHSSDYKHFLTYASILLNNGKKSDALKMANHSLELAKGSRAEISIKRFIQKIENS